MNHLVIMGNLTRDPELRFTQANLAVCRFSLAHNEKRGNENKVTYLDCTVFGKTAEAFQKYHTKGTRALVEGRIQQETWADKTTGEQRSKLAMIVERWHFASAKQDASRPAAAPASINNPNDDWFPAAAEIDVDAPF